jgi:type I restriction enzyme M protein
MVQPCLLAMQVVAKVKYAKYIIENDWLECIIALPKNIFYNTGIPTYIWIVSNKKAPETQRQSAVNKCNGNVRKTA